MTSTRLNRSLFAGVLLATGLLVSVAPSHVVAAGDPSRFVPVTPCRLLDTRTSTGTVAAAGTVDVETVGPRCGIPAEATAVAVTVTAVNARGPGFVTIWPSGAPRPEASALNYAPGDVVANAQLVQLGTAGRVSLYTLARADLLLDVSGYFERASGPVASGRFVAVPAVRVLDTRQGGRPAAGQSVTVRPQGVPTNATAVAVNITTTASSGPGFFSAYPAGMNRPEVSVLNTDRSGQTRAAAAIVPVTDGAFEVFSLLGDHVIVDLTGYFTGTGQSSTVGRFVPTTPTRLVDTRLTAGTSGGPRLWDNGAREFDVSTITGGPVAAIAANVTMTLAEDAGFVTAAAARTAVTTTSTVNATGAQMTIANGAIVTVSTAGVRFSTLHGTHLVVDITGWFTGSPVATTTGPPANVATGDRTVTIISDSTMAGIRWNGAAGGLQGFTPVLKVESCRRLVQSSCRGREGYAPPTTLSEIQAMPTAGPEDVLLVSAGYDDWYGRFSSDFDIIIAAARAKGFRHIVWPTYIVSGNYTQPGSLAPNYAAMNGVLAAKVASGFFPEVRVWDLNGYVFGTTGWFYSDGIHETRLGSWGIADWISRHMRAYDDRPCVQPWSPGGPLDNPCLNPDPLPPIRGHPNIAALYSL